MLCHHHECHHIPLLLRLSFSVSYLLLYPVSNGAGRRDTFRLFRSAMGDSSVILLIGRGLQWYARAVERRRVIAN